MTSFSEQRSMGSFTYNVRYFWASFDLRTYLPRQMSFSPQHQIFSGFTNQPTLKFNVILLKMSMGSFTYDVRYFSAFFDLPTFLVRWLLALSVRYFQALLTNLPENLTSYLFDCSLWEHSHFWVGRYVKLHLMISDVGRRVGQRESDVISVIFAISNLWINYTLQYF